MGLWSFQLVIGKLFFLGGGGIDSLYDAFVCQFYVGSYIFIF